MRRILFVLAVIASALTADAQQKAFTLDEILSAPFPSELVASPTGGKVAWLFIAKGVRNIWAAEAPDFKSHAVTKYTDDDGQDIAQLAWTPDGQSIVYARGGDFEMGREAPNPRGFAAGVEQAIYVVNASGAESPRRIVEGNSPVVSPKGDRVAYLLRGQVWTVGLSGTAKPEQLIHARGSAGSLRWSPDGARLAFVSDQGDHSFVGVYEIGAKEVRYLDPSVDRDAEPAWSPDGKQVAFVRIPASRQAFAFGPERSGQPWSIRVADVATGVGREVWRAEEGRGSVFREMVAANQVFWGDEAAIVFPWEKDGWLHLYSVSSRAGQAKLLTPGNFEIEHVTMAPDRRQILFSSNQDDIDHRHLWKVGIESGPPVAVTKGDGIEWAPVFTVDGQAIALLRSDARRPARPAIIMPNSPVRDLAPEAIPANFPSDTLVIPQQVIISAADGMKIHCQLFLPSGSTAGQSRPAAVFFHGGSRRQMLLGWHYMYYYHNAYAMNQYLATQGGYVVLSVNYRSGIGYGMEFREALNYGATGASEFNDVLGAGLYLKARPDVQPDKIGLWGGSYGGYLTAMGLARASNLFAAGVDLHGVHDWNAVIRNFVPAFNPETQQDAARLAFSSSPMASVENWRSPVLFIHGDDDRNVPFSETVQMIATLRARRVEIEQLIFPGEVHDFLTWASWLQAYKAAVSFFDRHLMKR
ncbi:MAG: prolyl oligopeptidase family serine peptidase [Acidobacteriota bacterium]|jgi:dipeptidyl aminopeptidase/acylaminoacyl peptidase